MTLTIHAVPFNSDTLRAECGHRLGYGGHTGHFRPLRAIGDNRLCEKCARPGDREERIAEAEAARDGGMEAATNAADPRLILAIDKVIAELNATGMPWSANDARDALPVVCSGLVGARVHAAAMRRPVEMRKVGMTRSTLLSTKSAWLAVWQGVQS